MIESYIVKQEGRYKSDAVPTRLRALVRLHLSGIAEMSPKNLTTQTVNSVLSPLWINKPSVGWAVQSLLKNALDYGRTLGHLGPDAADKINPATYNGLLEHSLPKTKHKTVHRPSMPYTEVPALFKTLLQSDRVPAQCLALIILLGSRKSEITGLTFEEIDPIKAIATIPDSRMKTNEDFVVPLPPVALQIIDRRRALMGGTGFVFAGRRNHISSPAMAPYVPDGFTVHGFRSSLRDFLAVECAGRVSFEVAELTLSHRIGSKVSRAYFRDDMLEARRQALQLWTNYLIS